MFLDRAVEGAAGSEQGLQKLPGVCRRGFSVCLPLGREENARKEEGQLGSRASPTRAGLSASCSSGKVQLGSAPTSWSGPFVFFAGWWCMPGWRKLPSAPHRQRDTHASAQPRTPYRTCRFLSFRQAVTKALWLIQICIFFFSSKVKIVARCMGLKDLQYLNFWSNNQLCFRYYVYGRELCLWQERNVMI